MSAQLVTLTGNVIGPPELHFTPSGRARLVLQIACNDRYLDKSTGEWKDADAFFTRVGAWGDLAERIADSVSKGQRVIVTGSFRSRSWDDATTGEKRYATEFQADDLGLSCRWAQVSARKVTGSRQGHPEQAPETSDVPSALVSSGSAPF